MATFTWQPAPGARRDLKPRALVAGFGDGYEQRTGDGINTKLPRWEVRFSSVKARADAINAFLDARNGVESFDWTDPTGVSGKYVCREWNREEHGGGVASISATFEAVPA